MDFRAPRPIYVRLIEMTCVQGIIQLQNSVTASTDSMNDISV